MPQTGQPALPASSEPAPPRLKPFDTSRGSIQGLTLYLRLPVAGMRQMVDCHSHTYQRKVLNPGIAALGWLAGCRYPRGIGLITVHSPAFATAALRASWESADGE